MSIEEIPVAIGSAAELDEPIDAVPLACQESPNETVVGTAPCAIDDFVADSSDESVRDTVPSAINDFVAGTSAEDVDTAIRDASMPSVVTWFFMMKMKHDKFFDNFSFLQKMCSFFLSTVSAF